MILTINQKENEKFTQFKRNTSPLIISNHLIQSYFYDYNRIWITSEYLNDNKDSKILVVNHDKWHQTTEVHLIYFKVTHEYREEIYNKKEIKSVAFLGSLNIHDNTVYIINKKVNEYVNNGKKYQLICIEKVDCYENDINPNDKYYLVTAKMFNSKDKKIDIVRYAVENVDNDIFVSKEMRF